MRYIISVPNPADRLIHIELIINSIAGSGEVLLQLPSWRPGRYEVGNFAKNIHSIRVVDEKNESLPFRKITKDCWKVLSTNDSKSTTGEIHVHYTYYAAQPDAGGCWVDEQTVYINPVHCCLYVPELIQQQCILELSVPADYQVATSLEIGTISSFLNQEEAQKRMVGKKADSKLLFATNFHELVDSPILASPGLQHQSYQVEDNTFHIWIHGECNPEWSKVINDFRKFTLEQIQTMGSIPTPDFHFLVLALPYKFHHGVEHLHSTVLAIGPGTELMKGELYNDFVGVASHELFHVWNVKTIRPQSLLPYDYTKENYSRLGFVYEGVTTYYGDLFLGRCGVYSDEQFLKEISGRLQRHFDNYGRFNLSVADSSFDTWLDGYVPGIPWRKTSIYDEGCLIALMCDLMIRRKTNGEKSLDDVMRVLYNDFGKKHIGYTEQDYISIIENMTNESASDFFIDYVYGTEDYEPLLSDLLHYFGCAITKTDSPAACEHHFGFKISVINGIIKVTHVAPGSPAYKAGLSKDDELIAVDEQTIDKNLNELLNYYINLDGHAKILLKVSTPLKKLKTVALEISKDKFFPCCAITKIANPSTQQQKSFSDWLKTQVRTAIGGSKLYGMN